MKKLELILLGFMMSLPILCSGQNKVDFGIFLGYGEHGSDVHSWGRHGAMLTENSAFAYGANLKLNFKDNLGLRLNYWGSEISGQDATLDELPGHDLRDYSFTSPVNELSLVLEYDLFGNKRWQNKEGESLKATGGSFRRAISPYIFGGAGLSFTDPSVDFGDDPLSVNESEDIDNTKTTNFQIPVGGGIRFDLTPTVYVSAEASSRIPINDYLEGISESANPEKNDSYQFIGLNIGFRIGSRDDRDNDGIIDSQDSCPDVPGIASFKGCPDSDLDGIEDSKDNCPNIAGLAEFTGCPDTDMDGIDDSKDSCPSIAGLMEFNGCPDSDKDGVEDSKDSCPQVPGLVKFAGCPDTDGDSIPDDLDKCPTEAGSAENAGCPFVDLDRDGDGINDDVDECPDVAGTINGCPDRDNDGFADKDDACPSTPGTMDGCPDSDGDGLADNVDNCPNKVGPISNKGCPRAGKSRADIINEFYINDIYFDSNQSVIKQGSRYRIQEAVAFSKQFPEASFIITGHTDDRNSNDYNLNLSEKRAKRVYDALVKGGIDRSKLSIDYKGEAQPNSSNATEAEMQRNRRVEIQAVVK